MKSSPSPTKPSQRRQPSSLASPDKTTKSLYAAAQSGENVRMEDPSYRSPPQKKFTSPKRPNASSGTKTAALSPSKHVAPFGQPLEIIKSKYWYLLRRLRISATFARFMEHLIDLCPLCFYRQTLLDLWRNTSHEYPQCFLLQHWQRKWTNNLASTSLN